MADNAQPLNNQIAITDDKGRPTDFFIRWAKRFSQRTPSQQEVVDAVDAVDTLTNRVDNLVLDDLLDVDVPSPTDNQVLSYDSTSSSWVPKTPSGGGGGGNDYEGSVPLSLSNGVFAAGNVGLVGFIAPSDIKITHICFVAASASATSRIAPVVYSANPANPSALLATGPQVVGAVAGTNEIPLTSELSVTKGTLVWIGLQVLTANITFVGPAYSGTGTYFASSTYPPTSTAPATSVATSAGWVAMYAKVNGGGGGP